jgi:hypothetical protein
MKIKGLVGTGFMVVTALAQTQPATEAPVVLKSTTRLVQVSVVVQRHGQPVADLKKEDFQLHENGRPQKIDLFNVESTCSNALPQAANPLPRVFIRMNWSSAPARRAA